MSRLKLIISYSHWLTVKLSRVMIERFLDIPNERVCHFVIKLLSAFKPHYLIVFTSHRITTQSDFCLLVAIRCLLAWPWDFQTASVGSRVACVVFAIAAVNLISPSSHLWTWLGVLNIWHLKSACSSEAVGPDHPPLCGLWEGGSPEITADID